MSTLKEIQWLVKEAQEANSEHTQTDLIPRIKSALSECTDLNPKFRRALVKLIPELLDEQTLEATPTPINLEQLVEQLEAGTVPVPESGPGEWTPF